MISWCCFAVIACQINILVVINIKLLQIIMKNTLIIIFSISTMLFSSCKNKSKSSNETIEKPKQEIKENDFSNLVSSDYEIEYDAKGDLNGDNINDIALVIKRKKDFKGDRKVLIFIREKNNYRLDKTSETVFPNKFISEDLDIKKYYQEEITISNKELNIKLFGTGPVSNNFSKFKYFNEKLILINIETYCMGAGSHSSSIYDLLESKLTEETTNTLEENMPKETQIFNLSKKEYIFESCNPEDIIAEAYNKVDL